MIVVSDTTPINYLVLIEQAGVLRLMYGRVVIPQAVFDEMQRERAPAQVREWLSHRATWLEVLEIEASPDAAPEKLGEGEREAIVLSERLGADAIIIDERAGVREALR